MNTIAIHQLKTVAPYFDSVLDGSKTFEFRYDDRGYKVGDILILREFLTRQQIYTGRWLEVEVTYILSSYVGMEHGYVVLGIKASPQVASIDSTLDSIKSVTLP